MLVIYQLGSLDDKKIEVESGFIRREGSPDIGKLIHQSDLIITVGNIDISNYDLSDLINEIKDKYKRSSMLFSIPVLRNINEIQMHVFYEI